MIYFDNAATTKPLLAALEKAKIYNEQNFFNPSALYKGGLDNHNDIKNSKEFLLSAIGADDYDLIFTSCGTESDNQAILENSCRGSFCTDCGEHAAVYKSFCQLKDNGKNVYFVSLNKDGTVNTDELFDMIKQDATIEFVSISHVNNETGAVNDINYIASTVKKINPKIIFHSDGVQAYGKLPYKIGKDIDLYSVSAHKINALKGVGALIKKKGVNIKPLIVGGGQENGLRSGTENIYGIKVFEYAAREKFAKIKENYERVAELKKEIENGLSSEIFVRISGENSSPFILSVSAPKMRGEVITHALEEENIIIGNGSACSSKNRYSRVIEACGYKQDILDGVLRISFSAENTLDEAKIFIEKINSIAKNLKRIMK